EVPEVAFCQFMKNFIITHGGLQEGVPIDQPLAAINQFVSEEREEGPANGAGTNRVQRETGALPITATAHLLELAQNSGLVLFLPFPDSFDKFFSSQIVSGEILFFKQPPLHHGLGGN